MHSLEMFFTVPPLSIAMEEFMLLVTPVEVKITYQHLSQMAPKHGILINRRLVSPLPELWILPSFLVNRGNYITGAMMVNYIALTSGLDLRLQIGPCSKVMENGTGLGQAIL